MTVVREILRLELGCWRKVLFTTTVHNVNFLSPNNPCFIRIEERKVMCLDRYRDRWDYKQGRIEILYLSSRVTFWLGYKIFRVYRRWGPSNKVVMKETTPLRLKKALYGGRIVLLCRVIKFLFFYVIYF